MKMHFMELPHWFIYLDSIKLVAQSFESVHQVQRNILQL